MGGFGGGAECARAGKVGACVVGIARAHTNRLEESEIRGATFQCMNNAAYNTPAGPYSSHVAIATLSKVVGLTARFRSKAVATLP
jgi:hypothetical protein